MHPFTINDKQSEYVKSSILKLFVWLCAEVVLCKMFLLPFQHVTDQVSGTWVNLGELWMWERPQKSQGSLELDSGVRG